jgi:uncharacterized membrane protein
MRATPWIIALLVSVLVNGALVGFVLHRVSGGPQIGVERERGSGPSLRGAFNLRGFLQALPEERRPAAQQRFREEGPRIRELMREAAQARMAAEEAFRSEGFDLERSRQAMRSMRESRHAVEAHIEGVVLEIVADLDRETRLRALQAGRRGPPGGPPPRRLRDRFERPPPPPPGRGG